MSAERKGRSRSLVWRSAAVLLLFVAPAAKAEVAVLGVFGLGQREWPTPQSFVITGLGVDVTSNKAAVNGRVTLVVDGALTAVSVQVPAGYTGPLTATGSVVVPAGSTFGFRSAADAGNFATTVLVTTQSHNGFASRRRRNSG